jgi:D-alanyl-D-alanine carboxypeptidase/D-alanyl-D-alanine-endopeptidase (penicillin-binding protein 4)
MRPASTEKVATAVTALDLLGPGYALTTQILTTASKTGSVLTGDIYIKGVMGPLLTAADVRSLANQLRAAGIRTINGRLIVDASFKDSDEFG